MGHGTALLDASRDHGIGDGCMVAEDDTNNGGPSSGKSHGKSLLTLLRTSSHLICNLVQELNQQMASWIKKISCLDASAIPDFK